ncbi:metallophosphoesterase [Pelosinus propionicus]|uniref:Calcineurin-like phosphoesterase n=1 Tax=Pelosinus propionicus DSM 13327 TaxID=1123291 RepID=A0A1I4P7Z6_9FIRM|nr:metallophosphoesterase [Pelosinus propionicus]SFM23984.1 Calcineurin-like phosphoesterase [Pelosinus propionicus DSM 13327]
MINEVSFIHLSDIHFNKYSGDVYDVDSNLRNEIIRDINLNAKTVLKDVKGILVCGDIAFSGQEQEYKTAQTFLKEICSVLEIPETSVFCVPGNHDVDQNIPKRSTGLGLIQADIENAKTSVEIDNKLSQYLRDPLCEELIFGHINTYNTKFAGQYGCNINTKNPVWQQEVTLNDNSVLCIHGMNSTIISSAADHLDKTKERLMIIGEYQLPKRRDGMIYLTLCHHPPECWKDPDNTLKNKFDKRVSIQLYGHKHIQDISQNGNALIIGCGATQPIRSSDDWLPTYNWISLSIDSSKAERLLNIKVFPRILDEIGDQFIADSHSCGLGNCLEYSLKIDDARVESDVKVEETIEEKFPQNAIKMNENIDLPGKNIDIKTLVYRFLNLPFLCRTQILSKLNLIDEKDEGINHVNLLEKIITRAKERNYLDDLWLEIERY